jgi:hypothetical protein
MHLCVPTCSSQTATDHGSVNVMQPLLRMQMISSSSSKCSGSTAQHSYEVCNSCIDFTLPMPKSHSDLILPDSTFQPCSFWNIYNRPRYNDPLPTHPAILILKNAVFWDVALCRSCVNRRFREMYRLHLQGRIIQSGFSLQPPAHAGSSHADFLPWIWRRYIPPKRRFTQDLHGTASQKTAFFMVTAMKTSNLPILILLCVFIVTGTCLQSCCLAMTGGIHTEIHRHTGKVC